MRTTFFILSLIVLLGCEQTKPQAREGFIEVEGGKIWYRIVGSGDKTPLLLLHGGPGMPSAYLRPLEALADERTVIFYDQLGCGRSDRPADSSRWVISRFVRELATLREKLKLEEVHVLAHSWGTMLLAEYLREKPKGIKTMIMAGPAISVARWLDDANRLRSALPQAVRDSLEINERRGTVTSQSYQEATRVFYDRHVCRIPFTADIEETFAGLGTGPYHTMWGNNEFTCTGNLAGFDASDVLGSITVPVLFTCGEHDEATPATTRWYAGQVKDASVEVLADASHFTMNERPETYIKLVRTFLNANE